jgi:hypothetical protein
MVRLLLETGAATVTDTDVNGATVWELLSFERVDAVQGLELSSLIDVMLTLGNAPPAFVAKFGSYFSQLHVAETNRRIRVQILEHCPLPAVLQSIVTTYTETTSEEPSSRTTEMQPHDSAVSRKMEIFANTRPFYWSLVWLYL